MTTKKNSGGGSGDRSGPRMKSSHERVLDSDSKPKSRAKPAPARKRPALLLRAKEATLPSLDASRDKSRGSKKARTPQDVPQPDRHGAWSAAAESSRQTATAIAVAALEKKAAGVEVLDVAGKVDYADFIVIMTGRSDRHAQALAQSIEEALKRKGVRPTAVEGLPQGAWILMDFGDVVVHVFQDDARRLYDLEGLWLDALRLALPKAELSPSDMME